jgi:yeast amino acid transporter
MSDSHPSPDKEKAFQIDTVPAEHANSKGSHAPPAWALHRDLKNRHVAMIRYVAALSGF